MIELYSQTFFFSLFFFIGPAALELSDEKREEDHTSTIANLVQDENVVNDHETEKYYE